MRTSTNSPALSWALDAPARSVARCWSWDRWRQRWPAVSRERAEEQARAARRMAAECGLMAPYVARN